MKKGFWNYTEEIEYTVILVKLLKDNATPMSWQNAFEGQERQIVAITYKKTDGSTYQFWIDNQDGSGLHKIAAGGGPGSYSAHVSNFEFIRELPERGWQQWDEFLHRKYRILCDEWQEKNFPEDYKRLESLRETSKLIKSGNYHIGKNGQIVPGKK